MKCFMSIATLIAAILVPALAGAQVITGKFY